MAEAAYVAGNPRWAGHPRLVVLSGCSGGGKSTLLAEMARRGYATFPEPGRQVVKEEALVDGPALYWRDPVRFAERCIARAAYFYNIADPGQGPVLFDRSIIDAATALERLRAAGPHVQAAVRQYRYGRVFLVPPWGELFATDTERRHGFDEAVAEYDTLVDSFAAKGYEAEVLPRIGVAARADMLEARLAETD